MITIKSRFLLFVFLLIGFCCGAQNQSRQSGDVCYSTEEKKLYDLINSYRKLKSLPVIPLSKSLTLVAQLHAEDLVTNRPDTGECNLHSWSDKGTWKGCCYYDDHRNAELMWSKPAELTEFKSTGYEIAHWASDGADAEGAIASWKSSSGHNEVILNKGVWKSYKWKAIGIAIRGNYAMIWFAAETDPAGSPKACKK